MKIHALSLACLVALSLQGSLAGFAQEDQGAGKGNDNGGLQSEQAAEDALKPPKVLNGSVSKTGETAATPQEGGADQSSLKSGAAQEGTDQPLDGSASYDKKFAFVKKLKKGKLTADDYRQVGFGVTGFESLKLLFARYPTIIRIFPGCPAEQAGMKVGDVLVSAGSHTFTWRDRQPEFWKVMDGRAGTTIDVTVTRKNEPMTFHVVRMNIEDVPDDRLRKMYERMLRILGDNSDGDGM